jgi:MacB-like periplasmic core domain
MRRVALKSLVFRRTRAILTALAIVLGVSMISGTYVLTDTIDRAFTDIFNSSYKDTSAVISGREIVKGSSSGTPTVPASLLDRVKRLPDVEAAAGAIMDLSSEGDSAKLIDANGKPIGGKQAPTLAFGIDTAQPRFNPLRLTEGRWASGGGELVIDAATATSTASTSARRSASPRAARSGTTASPASPSTGRWTRSAGPRSPSSRSRQHSSCSASRGSSTASRWPPGRASRRSAWSHRSAPSCRPLRRCRPPSSAPTRTPRMSRHSSSSCARSCSHSPRSRCSSAGS